MPAGRSVPRGSPGHLCRGSHHHQGKPHVRQGTEGLTSPDQPLPSCPAICCSASLQLLTALPCLALGWPRPVPVPQPCTPILGLCVASVPLSRISSRLTSPSAGLGQGSVTVPPSLVFSPVLPAEGSLVRDRRRHTASLRARLTTGFRPECQGTA